jgi:hypothetical protein
VVGATEQPFSWALGAEYRRPVDRFGIEALLMRPTDFEGMELEEGMVRKIAISVGAVGVFVALVVGVGTSFNDGGLGSTGGLALVAAITVFVLAMAAIGLFLAQ